jgi:hypothetical protein
MRKQYLKEAIELFDDNDPRSFNELYEGQEDLFKDVDSLINPKFRKLFEETYQVGNVQQKRLRECDVKYGAANGFQELDNRNDGVPEGHNRSLAPSGGSSPKVRQSKPNYSTNKSLNEGSSSDILHLDADIPRGSPYYSTDENIEHAKMRSDREHATKMMHKRRQDLGLDELLIESFERIFENSNPSGAADNNPRQGPKPGNDGVPSGHNPALSKGPTSQVTQSGARQDDDSKLGSEPAMGYGNGPKAPNRG